MRKAQKKQVEAFVRLLEEAHQEIKNAIRKKNIDLAKNLLEQCWNGANQATVMIAALEGEEFVTVSFLQAYSEVVNQVYIALEQSLIIKEKDAEQMLQEGWNAVNDSVKNDIHERKEVVFCPYKASMWDSLESVWKAAEEDDTCDAYVVPIPYFDKKPDGSFGEMHYEGNEYPDYVPVTDYREYDFEKRKPDMIFIHNPYDEYNHVTSIHPYFYAPNLKKFTEKLVYIPYFILEELRKDVMTTMTEESKQKILSFCIQPGVIESDVVIVQSEAMKKLYVDLLSEYFGEETRKRWKNKILGLGSPKTDKILSTKEEELEIPEEWKNVLYKKNGMRRKIILYNTSVNALLQYDNAMLEKMQRVFQTFYENREEVALLWRPHPLIKATIESMRPSLWRDYEKLVQEYKEAGWGIYDDTADLNRALELADAYYGDVSSLVQLCQEKRMPITIQDVEVQDIESAWNVVKWNLTLYPAMGYSVRRNNFLYYFAYNCNAFMRVNLLNGTVEYLASLDDEDEKEKGLLSTIGIYNEFILFSSSAARNIYVYDLKKNKFIKANTAKDREEISIRAGRNIILKNKVHFFPSTGKKEVCLDLQTLSITETSEIYDKYLKYEKMESGVFVIANSYEYEDKVYVAIRDKGYIIECSLEKQEYNYYKINDVSTGFIQMCGVENKLYLLAYDKKIIQWNIDTNTVEHIWNIELDEQRDIGRLQTCIRIEDNIYFIGIGLWGFTQHDFGVKLNLTSNVITIFTYEEEFGIVSKLGEKYTFSLIDEHENMYFISTYHNLAIVNLRTKQYKNMRLNYQCTRRENLKNDKIKINNSIGKNVWKRFVS